MAALHAQAEVVSDSNTDSRHESNLLDTTYAISRHFNTYAITVRSVQVTQCVLTAKQTSVSCQPPAALHPPVATGRQPAAASDESGVPFAAAATFC